MLAGVPGAGFLSPLVRESIAGCPPAEGAWMPEPALLWQLLPLPIPPLVYS